MGCGHLTTCMRVGHIVQVSMVCVSVCVSVCVCVFICTNVCVCIREAVEKQA